jgi:hypothetical protein
VTKNQDNETLKRKFKFRYEIGRGFNKNFVYPESLYTPFPDIVPDPFTRRNNNYVIKSLGLAPVRALKHLILGNHSAGY